MCTPLTRAGLSWIAFAGTSYDLGSARKVTGDVSNIINGVRNPSLWKEEPRFSMPTSGCHQTPPSITVDLLSLHRIDQVILWQYYREGHFRTYCSNRIALSASGDFEADGVDLVNYGAQYGPVTSEKGLVVDVETIRYARYVTVWW